MVEQVKGWTAAGVAAVVAAWRWTLAPFVDHWRGLSLTRILAVLIIAIAWRASDAHGVTANVVWLAALAIATAFGKSTFQMLTSRMTLASTTVDNTVRTVTEAIEKRRAASDHPGTEPTP